MNFTTKVDKNQLIDQITAHLNEHIILYEEAVNGFKNAVQEELNTLLNKVRNAEYLNNPTTIIYRKDMPVSYKKEYENAIKALEWTKDVIVELTPEQFKQYVLNDWTWSNHFYISNSMYSSGCMSKLGE